MRLAQSSASSSLPDFWKYPLSRKVMLQCLHAFLEVGYPGLSLRHGVAERYGGLL